MPKVVLFHRTVGPEYDDRLNKIFSTLCKFGIHSAHAYLWDRNNARISGAFAKGGSWTLLKIPFGSKTKPRPGAVYTVYEILFETFQSLLIIRESRPDVIILQNHRMFFLAFLLAVFKSSRYRLIWDLRELPKGFYNNGVVPRLFFSRLLAKFDVIISTNEARKKFLEGSFGCRSLKCSTVLPNYPLRAWASGGDASIWSDEIQANADERFVYIQSASVASRYPYNSVKAALLATNLRVVVTGGFDHKALIELKAEFGATLEKRVLFLGFVSGAQISSLLDRSLVSLIFYQSTDPNNEFCDPNRLYQAIIKGVPVIVGKNQGLGALVSRLECGVVLSDDGSSLPLILDAFGVLTANYDKIKSNADAARSELAWEDVESRLIDAILGRFPVI